MKTDANEPINPVTTYGNIGGNGLTKREYFAAMAMQGILAGLALDEKMTIAQLEYYVRKYGEGVVMFDAVAMESVGMADHLIEKLNETHR